MTRQPQRLLYMWLLLATATWPAAVPAAERVELPSPMTPFSEAEQVAPEARPEEALSVNEPMYFLVGDGTELNARFQLSFKYRMFDERGRLAKALPALTGLYVGYTQTSLWNLDEESKPFEDTSYRPSLFWLYDTGRRRLLPASLRLGYEHESNGRGESASRSIDTLFLQPSWKTTVNHRKLTFSPKFYAYLDDEDNPDIDQYRGNADWIFRYGNEDSWIWRLLARYGEGGRLTTQVDVSYPMREPLFTRTGAFFHIQALHGYGETLLGYDERVDLNVWIGVSVVR